MSRTRIVGGKITEIIHGDYNIYSASDIIFNSEKSVIPNGKQGVIIGNKVEKITSKDNSTKINFLVHFEIDEEKYDGSFGFDWMCDKNDCIDYEKLKKEYIPIGSKEVWTPNNKEYFVPWISVIPDKIVKLKVKIEKIEGKLLTEEDIIRFPKPKSNNIYMEPIDINVIEDTHEYIAIRPIDFNLVDNEDKKKMLYINIHYKVDQDTLYNVMNQHGVSIGKLNFFKNNEIIEVDLKFVKMCHKRHLQELEEKYSVRKNEGFIDFLNNNSINQALIKVNIIEQDYKKWDFFNLDELSKDFLDEILEGLELKESGRNKLYEEYINNHLDKNFKGIVVLFTSIYRKRINDNSDVGGDARIIPLNDQIVFIYEKSEHNTDLPHEIGHTLGLHHTFSDNTKKLKECEEYIEKAKENIKIITNNIKIIKQSKNTNKVNTYEEIEKYSKDIENYKKEIKYCEEKIESFKNNPYRFEKNQTYNMMDYKDIKIKRFFHWQWVVMRNEIKEYHSVKI